MKILKSKKSLIIVGVSLLLIIAGAVLILTGNNKSFIQKPKPGEENPDNNKPDDTKPIVKVFTKADVMSLVYQFKALNNIQENWYVGDSAVLAHNADNSKYLVRYKAVLEDGSTKEYESIVENVEGELKMDVPGWDVDSKPLDEFQFIYYQEGAEDYDPMNQQYNPEVTPGWDPGENNWDNYVPDNSWQSQTS